MEHLIELRKRLLATYSHRIGVLTEDQTRLYTIVTGVILGVLVTISSVGAGAQVATGSPAADRRCQRARRWESHASRIAPLTASASPESRSTGP